MSLFLREISRHENDRELVSLFAQYRDKVCAVTTAPLLPNLVAVTVESVGFIELINIKTGAFRLFLTQLGEVPLDAELRCFSLAPCLCAALQSSRHQSARSSAPPCCLVYSLSFSNQLLACDVERGVVEVLRECPSRPSTVLVDGDYIVLGEGSGQVTVWRTKEQMSGSHTRERAGAASLTSLTLLMWTIQTLQDSVTKFTRRRHQLFCCGADLSCQIVHVDTGVVLGRLLHEPAPLLALLPVGTALPMDQRGTLVGAFRHEIAIYREQEPTPPPEVEMVADPQRSNVQVLPPVESRATYLEVGQWVSSAPLACVTSSRSYVVAGSSSGLVVLFRCKVEYGALEELVRFDVGFSVAAVQLFEEEVTGEVVDSLLVVTAAGDVWRWPMEDLLKPVVEREDRIEPGPAAPDVCPQPTPCPERPSTSCERADGNSDSDGTGEEEGVTVVGVELEQEGPDTCGVEPNPFLGPALDSIPGLRRGKRMDPRVVDAILRNVDTRAEAELCEGVAVIEVEEESTLPPLALAQPGVQGSVLQLECAEALLEEPFDEAAFRAAHPLLAQAADFQFPVQSRQFGRSEEVFRDVPRMVAEQLAHGRPDAQRITGAPDAPAGGEGDDLRDVTQGHICRRRDPRLEEERCGEGPDLLQGCWEDLLKGTKEPAELILFTERHLRPSETETLPLPLPLPSTFPVY